MSNEKLTTPSLFDLFSEIIEAGGVEKYAEDANPETCAELPSMPCEVPEVASCSQGPPIPQSVER